MTKRPELATTNARPPRHRVAVLLILLVVMTWTTIRIERLNVKAGGMLPSRELRSDSGSPVTWREWPVHEQWYEDHLDKKDDQGIAVPLSPQDRAQIKADVARAKANNALRSTVMTWGLAQYVIIPVSLGLALSICTRRVPRSYRAIGGLSLGITGLIAALVWYRAYFWSLGI